MGCRQRGRGRGSPGAGSMQTPSGLSSVPSHSVNRTSLGGPLLGPLHLRHRDTEAQWRWACPEAPGSKGRASPCSWGWGGSPPGSGGARQAGLQTATPATGLLGRWCKGRLDPSRPHAGSQRDGSCPRSTVTAMRKVGAGLGAATGNVHTCVSHVYPHHVCVCVQTRVSYTRSTSMSS